MTTLSNRALKRGAKMAEGPKVTIPDLQARLAAMPSPRLTEHERELVERVLAAGFVAIPGASLDVHRALARRGVEKALRREIREHSAGGRP